MSKLSKDNLEQVLELMQEMKLQISAGNWEELDRLDGERRKIILDAENTGTDKLDENNTTDPQENINNHNRQANFTHSRSDQQSIERTELVEKIRSLDEEINKDSLSARAALLDTNRKFSSQQKVKNLYAESCAQIR